MKITVADNLSGVSSFNAYLNGKWVLMTYDYKDGYMKYDFDEHLLKGSNSFSLFVKDAVGNVSKFEATLIY